METVHMSLSKTLILQTTLNFLYDICDCKVTLHILGLQIQEGEIALLVLPSWATSCDIIDVCGQPVKVAETNQPLGKRIESFIAPSFAKCLKPTFRRDDFLHLTKSAQKFHHFAQTFTRGTN